MSNYLKDDIALAATYILSTGLTFAVIYGCNEEQEKNILKYLRRAGNNTQHPLAMIRIFVEVERDCIVDRVEKLIDRFVGRTAQMRNETRGLKQILNRSGE